MYIDKLQMMKLMGGLWFDFDKHTCAPNSVLNFLCAALNSLHTHDRWQNQQSKLHVAYCKTLLSQMMLLCPFSLLLYKDEFGFITILFVCTVQVRKLVGGFISWWTWSLFFSMASSLRAWSGWNFYYMNKQVKRLIFNAGY